MTKHSARILRVAYNNAHRNILKLHMRCSASQMFADNILLNFEAKVVLDNLVARERMWEYWYSILY